MDFLSLYLIFQGIIIALALVIICYMIKKFLIPMINNKIEKDIKETIYKKDGKEPKIITETDTEVIYYYDNGDEYHSPMGRR